MNWREQITADPSVLVGKPVVRGTRLAVEFILGLIAQGWPEQEITRNYQLTPEQVRACVAYAQERLNDERVFAVGPWRCMRLCANETVPADCVVQLRRAGHDVLWIREAAPGISDSSVLARALSEDWLLITFDKDVGELVFRHGAHASQGIVLFRIAQPSASAVAD